MEKSIITKPVLVSFMAGAVIGGAICAAIYALNSPASTVPPIREMRHPLAEANGFINNYLQNPAMPPPIPETGWLVNSSELKAFVNDAYYVHISLARVSQATDKITLVISGATKEYNHCFPTTTDSNGREYPYALESVYPCPQCFNNLDDTRQGFKVSNQIAPDSSAVVR